MQNLTGFAFGLIFPAVVGLHTLFWLSASPLYLLRIALRVAVVGSGASLVMFGISQLARLAVVLLTGQFTMGSLGHAVLAIPLLFLITKGNRRYSLKISQVAVSRLSAVLLFMAGCGFIATAL